MSVATTALHSAQLTKRSVRGRLRQPAALAPAFIFPLFFAALGSASFNRLAQDPYFSANIATSFLNYAVAGAVVQGVLFGATSAASDLAADIEQHGPFRALDIAGKAPPGIQCRIIRIVVIYDSKG